MMDYHIRQIRPDEYGIIGKLNRDAFEYNERGSDGYWHEVFTDNIRRSPYYIPELELVAITDDGLVYLGHAVFSKLPMGDNGEHIIWLNSLAVKHGKEDNHAEKSYEYQRKGIGTALVMRGLEIAKSLDYVGCMTCGHPDVYRKKIGFSDYRDFGFAKDDSVYEPDGAIHAIELAPKGFDMTNKLLSFSYYDFTRNETLNHVLCKIFGAVIKNATYKSRQLHGGTLGDVRLVTGNAETIDGETLQFKVVRKTQKKWERYGDPGSWRREYDLYNSNLGATFFDSFRWPECYYSELRDDTIELWIEFIDGISGLDLTGDIYEQAAEELGRWQGKLYAEQPITLRSLTNLSSTSFMKTFYLHYRSWNIVYDYVRSNDSELPKHICEMLIEIDEKSDEIFNRIEKLPVVLCHRDFWVANIFHKDGSIRLIDWDTAGWGYLGEDMASLIADEADVPHMAEYYQKCVPAYYKGFSEYADISYITDNCVYELILLMFGYRLVEWFINVGAGNKPQETDDERALYLNTLQKIFEMRNYK